MKARFRSPKLEVWQEARRTNRVVCQLIKKLPREEMFAMTAQIRHAAISVSSNIAKGSGRNCGRDFAHFLEQAYGSLMEAASTVFLGVDEDHVAEADLEPLFDEPEHLTKRIASRNNSLDVVTCKTPFRRRPRT